MKRMLIVTVIGALVAGCGPSALEQRVCDMYVEAGGEEHDLAYWVKHFSQPEEIAKIEQENARTAGDKYPVHRTPQKEAESQFNYQIRKNAKVKAIVSARLSLSLREVDAALVKCGPKGK